VAEATAQTTVDRMTLLRSGTKSESLLGLLTIVGVFWSAEAVPLLFELGLLFSFQRRREKTLVGRERLLVTLAAEEGRVYSECF